MKIRDEMATIMVYIDPQRYREYLHEVRGRPTKTYRAHCAQLNSSRSSFVAHSRDGLKINPHETNKMINGQLCTILWHVDDLKIAHEYPHVVIGEIKRLEEKLYHCAWTNTLMVATKCLQLLKEAARQDMKESGCLLGILS